MLKAVIKDDGHVQIAINGDIKTLTLDITVFIRSIWNEANISDRGKEIFKDFVQNELGKVAFMDEDELENEVEMLKNKAEMLKNKLIDDEENLKKELTKLLNELLGGE